VRTGVFIQVRLGSTRLPAKAVLPLAGATVIQHVMRAVRQVGAEVHALLTDPASAEKLSPLAAAEEFLLFVGSPEDVLGRFCAACRQYEVDRVVRVTGDNPLTSANLASGILAVHDEARADLSHYLDVPWGMGVEAVESRALFQAERDAVDTAEREHITTHHYRHRERFRIVEEPPPAWAFMPEGRVTVDTPQDYERVKRLFQDLYAGSPIEADAVVRWLSGPGNRGREA
jgi:spore coat polysaccharide biosynthesis protein SpsF